MASLASIRKELKANSKKYELKKPDLRKSINVLRAALRAQKITIARRKPYSPDPALHQ